MRAARYHGRKDVRVDEIPKTVPKGNQVLIRVEWCGICGSDLHEYTDGPFACPTAERPHPLTGKSSPVILGHEFCGRVVEAPEDSRLKPGQGVMVDPRLWCHSCYPCKAGATNLCESFGFLGLSGTGGGLAEYVAVAPDNLYPLPDDAPLHLAALLEPLAVAWHSVTRSGVEVAGDMPVLVIGAGPIGAVVCIILRAHGAKKIVVSEPAKIRREKVAEFADVIIDPSTQSPSDILRSMTGGDGIKVLFDCAGIQAGMDEGLKALQPRGTYLNLAGWTTPWDPRQELVTCKELTLKSSMSYDHTDFGHVVDGFIKNKFPGLEKLVTARISLEDVVEKGLEELITNKDTQLKILVTPFPELLEV